MALEQRYLEIAEKTGGPILELRAAAGWAAIPLARAGYRVVGVDMSGGPLDEFQEELDREDRDVGHRIHVFQDIATLKLADPDFSLAIVAYDDGPSRPEALQVTAAAARHLAPGGVLALDLAGVAHLRRFELEPVLKSAGLELTSIGSGSLVTATKR
ncbi:class I SAM-dependent methyltransferase [Pendulispora rubella]|uniref:Class I SAM-dependent methyltransferase n=1 Tax=Pendulispora rubella TaxID=2741070 RepID=A0ABZ2LGT9_9BACT